LIGWLLSQRRIVVQVADDFSTKAPQVVHVLANRLSREPGRGQILDKGSEADDPFALRMTLRVARSNFRTLRGGPTRLQEFAFDHGSHSLDSIRHPFREESSYASTDEEYIDHRFPRSRCC
jgi:hypothetical protein